MLLFNTASVEESNHSLKIIKGGPRVDTHERGNPGSVFVSGLKILLGLPCVKKINRIFLNELKQEESSEILTTAHLSILPA